MFILTRIIAPNVQEIIIHPAPPASKDEFPLLKDVVAPPPKYFAKLLKHEDKPVLPSKKVYTLLNGKANFFKKIVQWLDFGAFSSFAPASDSNNANATYENTYMGRSAKRYKKWEKKQINKPRNEKGMDDTEINATWLAKEGLDINVIEAAMNKEPESVNEELERNSELLEELVNYQKSRFCGGESEWTAINEKEVEIGRCFSFTSLQIGFNLMFYIYIYI